MEDTIAEDEEWERDGVETNDMMMSSKVETLSMKC